MSSMKRFFNWKVWLGIGISLAALYWTFKDADPHEIISAVFRAHWIVLLLSFPVFISGLVIRSYRWSLLLKDDTSTFRQRYNAINIGFMVTSLLPLRLGEFARMFVFAKRTKRSAVEILTTIVVERFFDVLAIFILFVSALPFVPLVALEESGNAFLMAVARMPQWKIQATAWGSVTAMIAGFLLCARFGRNISEAMFGRLGLTHGKLLDILSSLFDGLETLWEKKRLMPVMFLSLFNWTIATLTFLVCLHAFPSGDTTLGAILGLQGAFFLQGVLCFFVALPSAPGFFGVWQFAAKTAFIPYTNADHGAILAFAVVVHMLNYLMTIMLGAEALSNEGLKWSEISTSEKTTES